MLIHLIEINEHTLGRPKLLGVSRSPAAWKLLSRCESNQMDSCILLKKLVALGRSNKKDGKSALSALDKLIQVAATGKPLNGFYDTKQSHPIHEFFYEGRNRVIWRIRSGDVRITFYYAEGKVIFLTDAFAKRSDKLTKGEQKQLEDEVKVYIDAEEKGQLVFISK